LGSRLVKHQIGSDADDLEARSPYYQVDKVKIPLLIVHGEDDAIVDVEQSRMLAGALKDLAKQSEYIELANGDHHLSIQRNRHTLFKAMDRFLKQQLK
jgi:dipeptidyl aminopeptidase/acylaminoacyl peptidase